MNRRNLRDAFLILFGVVALALVVWQRLQTRAGSRPAEM
jgi:predicted nucleic acid-binding Zn ribbon protein